jgi:hypothetical protein
MWTLVDRREIRRVTQLAKLAFTGQEAAKLQAYNAVFYNVATRQCYKDLSMLIHPDKNLSSVALATEAFKFLRNAADALLEC